MEKTLSASQRDRIYMNMAKDELLLKQSLVEKLTAATEASNKAFEKMASSIESVGSSIGNGLMMLAGAIGNATNNPNQLGNNLQAPQYPNQVSQSYPSAPNMQYQENGTYKKHYEQL